MNNNNLNKKLDYKYYGTILTTMAKFIHLFVIQSDEKILKLQIRCLIQLAVSRTDFSVFLYLNNYINNYKKADTKYFSQEKFQTLYKEKHIKACEIIKSEFKNNIIQESKNKDEVFKRTGLPYIPVTIETIKGKNNYCINTNDIKKHFKFTTAVSKQTTINTIYHWMLKKEALINAFIIYKQIPNNINCTQKNKAYNETVKIIKYLNINKVEFDNYINIQNANILNKKVKVT